MQMLDVEWFLDRGTAQLICLANTNPTLDAAASHPHGEAVTVVITPGALGILSGGLTPEFTSPNNQRFIEHTSLFEILKKAGDGLVSVPSVVIVVFFQVAVRIPVCIVVITAGIDLDVAHTPLHQAAGQEAFSTEVLSTIVVKAIKFFHMFWLTVKVHSFRRTHLHVVGQFIA